MDVSYFAAALARTPGGWTAEEIDLDGVEDVDGVADTLREVEEDADTALLFLEEDDEYVVVLRVDRGGDDPRVFISNARAADHYPIVEMLAVAVETAGDADVGDSDDSGDEADDSVADEDETPPGRDSEPLGDAELLADLGTPGADLLALCAHEGTLPSDVITEVCERAGCVDELEALRLP
jgi:putative tRNA adenosine deaminase-associated protein